LVAQSTPHPSIRDRERCEVPSALWRALCVNELLARPLPKQSKEPGRRRSIDRGCSCSCVARKRWTAPPSERSLHGIGYSGQARRGCGAEASLHVGVKQYDSGWGHGTRSLSPAEQGPFCSLTGRAERASPHRRRQTGFQPRTCGGSHWHWCLVGRSEPDGTVRIKWR
jgi:hypothetical protein